MPGWTSLLQFFTISDLLILTPACSLSLLSGVAEPAMSIFFARFFDAFALFGSNVIDETEFRAKTQTSFFALIGISTAMLVLRGGYLCLWLLFGEVQALAARKALFRALLARKAEWFQSNTTGVSAQMTELQICIRDFQLGVSQSLGFVLSNATQCVIALAISLYYNWRLALLIFIAIILTTILLSVISRSLPAAITNQQSELAMASKVVVHIVDNIVTVKCCNAQRQERLRYCRIISRAASFYLQQVRISAVRAGCTGFAITLILVGALLYADILIHQGYTTSASAMTTFFCCLMAAQGFQNIVPYLIVLEKGKVSASRLQAVLSDPHQVQLSLSRGLKLNPRMLQGEIVFKNVSFAYASRPEHLILHEANIVFHAGRLNFLTGQSGCGKSTITNLIQGKYQPQSGSVTIDGLDVQFLDEVWLRNNVTILQQNTRLFDETIYQNVNFGNNEHTGNDAHDVQNALDWACIIDEVLSLPGGLGTMLGHGACTLSGGQRQRLNLARTYLRDTPILILDEPIAALDPHLRSIMMTRIRNWRQGKTTIVITHDLSSIHEEDIVYLVRDKGITAADPHLLQSGTQDHTRTTALQNPRRTSMQHLHPFSHNPNLQAVVHHPGSASQLLPSRHTSDHPRFSRLSFPEGRAPSAWYRTSLLDNHSPQLLESRIKYEYATTQPSIRVGSKENDWDHHVKRASQSSLSESTVTGTISSQSLKGLKPILSSVWPVLTFGCRVGIISGLCSTVVHACCPAVFSYLVVQSFENWSKPEAWHDNAWRLAVAGVGLAIGDGVSSVLMHYLFEWVAQTWIDALRIQGLAHMLEQPKSWFDADHVSSSSISLTLSRNAEELRNIIGRYCALALVAFFMMAVSLAWSFKVCWKITIVVTACFPVLYGITKIFQSISQHWEGRTNDAGEGINRTFTEVFSNFDTVRGLTLESYFHRKYLSASTKAFQTGLKRSMYTGLLFGVAESAVYFVTTAVFAYGAFLVRVHAFTAPSILQSFALLLFSTSNANSIIAFVPQLSSSIDTGLKLLQLTKLETNSHESEGKVQPKQSSIQVEHESIIFNKVTFGYRDQSKLTVLRQLSLKIRASQWTAVVGASGSGKSTIASLLLKLYPLSLEEGSGHTNHSVPAIGAFGYDIDQLDTKTLRALISIVPQQPVIVPSTVRENILYGSLSEQLYNDENMYEAARASNIHDFITELPDGYETILGDGGVSLSGGQAQRITIARALSRQPRILILDEATSAIDQETAEQIRDGLISWVHATRARDIESSEPTHHAITIISITHDIEMMRAADHIVLINDGKVEEEGTFEELLGKRGSFWHLLNEESTPLKRQMGTL